ncbi:MAG: Fructose-1,6-bisphosphatase [Microgenomates group bacterium GW2011_GWA2_47_8]|nr:MAG: Fructose-1,6-bisphosphatase [Microgenomates group bacterium GW2011_GWA2_47_8]
MKTTLSIIKADTGSIGGHNRPSDVMLAKAKEAMGVAVKSGLLTDARVTFTGDDIALLMIHDKGTDNPDIHKLAWDTFVATTAIAKSQGLYGAGQDLLKDAFSGNVRGMGPGSAEIELEERPAEPFVVFAADKCGPGVFNYPFFCSFADPFHNAGLLLAPEMRALWRMQVDLLLQWPQQADFTISPESMWARMTRLLLSEPKNPFPIRVK